MNLFKKYILFVFCVILTYSGRSAVFPVSSNGDSGGGTLRNAITQANANGTGHDTIKLEFYSPLTLQSSLPTIATSLTILGLGADVSIIQADTAYNIANYRVFHISQSGVEVVLRDLTVQYGVSTSNGGGLYFQQGDSLHIYDCYFNENRSTGNIGGGLDFAAGKGLKIFRSAFVGNTQNSNGGGIGIHPSSNSEVHIENCTFSGNEGSSNQVNHGGGALHFYSFSGTHDIDLINCTFDENTLLGTSTNNGKSIFLAAITCTLNLKLLNCILDDHTSGNYAQYTQSGGVINIDRDYTLSSDASITTSGSGNVNNTSNVLDSLGLYGSNRPVYGLDTASIAIDAGTNIGVPWEDQRGVPKSGIKDIGAFERFEQACIIPTIPSPFVTTMASRKYTISSVNIDGQGNVANVNTGQSVTMSFSYTIGQNGNYCPGCGVQFYWGLKGTFGKCQRHYGGYCNCSGTGSQTFTAPAVPGVYLFTVGQSLLYSCGGTPQNYLSSSLGRAFGVLVVGNPVNGNVVTLSGPASFCASSGDSISANYFNGYTCTGNLLTSYQWYNGANAVSGATAKNHLPTSEGDYFVKWSNVQGDVVYSDTLEIRNEIHNINDSSNFALGSFSSNLSNYPSQVTVPLLNSQSGVTYSLIDTLTGTTVATITGNGSTRNLQFTPLPNRAYQIQGQNSNCSSDLDTLLSFSFTSPPLAGMYSVGSGADFTTFKEFTDSAAIVGVGGNITLEVKNGTFNERVVLNADSMPGYDSTFTFLIHQHPGNSGSAPEITFASTSSSNNGTFIINGVDNVTLRGLRLKNTGTSFGRVVEVIGGSDHTTIVNNIITGPVATAFSSNLANIYSGTSIDQGLVIDSNSIYQGSYGISIRGSSSKRESGTKIRSNTIKDFAASGITCWYLDSVKIIGNDIEDNGTLGVVNSITTAVCYYGIEVSYNKIVNNSTSSGEGIDIAICYHNSSNVGRVFNNAVSITNTNGGTTRGITISQSAYIKVFHNSVYLNTISSSTDAAGIYVKGTSSYKFNEITNNVVYCANGGYAVQFDATAVSSAVVSNMDNNNLYTNASVFGYFGATSISDFSSWKSTSSFDANSTNVNPYYESDTLLVPQALFMNDLADTNVVGVDITGATRSATPDFGAYEFTPPIPAPDYGDSIGSGKALNFDGVDDYVEIGTAGEFQNLTDFTIEFWYNPNTTGNDWLFTIGSAGESAATNVQASARIGPTTFQYLHEYGSGTNQTANFSGLSFSVGKWYHIAVSRDYSTKTIYLYVDGESQGSQNYSTDPSGGSSTYLTLGASLAANPDFEGQMDEFRFWTSVLPEVQIKDWMCKKLTSSHDSLESLNAYYRFDESGTNTLTDLTGSYDGTLKNMSSTTDWGVSGASLGDTSSNSYGASASSSISFSGGSSFTATATNGFSASEGIQVYQVIGIPNSLTKPVGIDSILTQSSYFGVHKAADSTDDYKVEIDYSGFTLTSDQKDKLVILKRENDADSTWEIASGRIHNVKASNTITIYGQTGTQYVLGFTNTTYPTRSGAGYALDFDGVNDFVDLGTDTLLKPTSAITVQMWAYHSEWDSVGTTSLLSNKEVGGYNIGTIDTSIYVGIRLNGAYTFVSTSLSTLNPGWNHIAFTYSGGIATLYINGVSVDSENAGSAYPIQHNVKRTFIGAEANGAGTNNYFEGRIDEVSVWGKALSIGEIRDWMCQKMTANHASVSDLRAYYRFDENVGDTLFDLTGLNHGVLNNMTPSSDWVISGAAIGDTAVYTASAPSLIDLTHSDGDRMRLSVGGSNQVAHLYMVEGAPLHTSLADSLATTGDTSRYWGVHFSNEDSALSALTYYYGSNSFFNTSNELNATLLGRSETGTGDWGVVNRPTSLNTGANIVTQASLQYSQQVIPGTQSTDVYAGFGHAMDFTGGGKHVDFPGETAFDFTDSLSFEAWVYVTSATNQLFHNGGSNGDPGYAIRFFSGSIRVEFRNGSVMHLDYPYASYMNEWHHWAVTWSKNTNEVKLYIDGEWVKTRNFYNSLPVYSGDPALGAKSDGSGGFGGYLDEVRIWNRTLTAEEIRANYKERIDSTADGLVAYFNFDDQYNPVLYDYSGNGNNGVLDGGLFTEGQDSLTLSISELASNGDTVGFAMGWDRDGETLTFKEISGDTGAFEVSSSTGLISVSSSASFNYSVKPTYNYTYEVTKSTSQQKDTATVVIELFEQAGSLHFDGSNDYVDLNGTLGSTGLNELTMEAWVKVSDTTGDFMAIISSAVGKLAHLQLHSTGNIAVYTNAGQIDLPIVAATPIGVWKHVALVAKSGESKVFVNGLQQGATDTTTFDSIYVSNTNYIGRGFTNARYFKGQIDEVRVWSRALCVEELGHRLKCQLDTANAADLMAYYSFNQGAAKVNNASIDSLFDYSGNGINGILNNFAKNDTLSNWLLQSDSVASGSCGTFTPTSGPEITVLDTTIYLDATGTVTLNAGALLDSITEECSSIDYIAVGTDTIYGVSSGENYFNGTFSGGIADVVEVTGNNANNWKGTALGSSCSESWYPRGTLCDEGGTQHNADSSYKSNSNSGATWYNTSPGSSYGILVVDMGTVAHISEMSVFQMYSDGKVTGVSVFASSELGSTPPAASGGTWTQLLNNQSIGAGASNGTYVTQPEKLSFPSTEARYFKLYFYNDGSLGNSGFIEVRNVKAFGATAELNYACADTGVNAQTFVVADAFGNTFTTSAQITVKDTLPPLLTVQTDTVYLDASGNASISTSALYSGASDNCDAPTIVFSGDTNVTCSDIGGGDDGIDSLYLLSNNKITALSLVNGGKNETFSVISANTYSAVYDKSSGKIFYVDGGSTLYKADRDGSNKVTLKSGISSAYDLEIDPANEYVYWAEYPTNDIKRIKYDGTSENTVYNGTGSGPYGFYLDVKNQVLYWSNLVTSTIHSINTDGTNYQTLVSGQSGARGVFYDETSSTLYWGTGSTVRRKVGAGSVQTILTGLTSSGGIAMNGDRTKLYAIDRSASKVIVSDPDGSNKSDLATGLTNPLFGHVGRSAYNSGDGGAKIAIIATDASGNTTTDTSYVTVLDTIAPSLTLRDDTLYVDANGNTDTLSISDLIVSATDNCAIADSTLDSLGYFDCTQLDTNAVSITVTDSSGNSTTAFATITVLDTIKPTFAHIGDTTLYLDASGNASVSLLSLCDSIYDNCSSVITVVADDSTFTCSDIDTTKALYFDGSNDEVRKNSPSGIPTGSAARTFEAWIKVDTTALVSNEGVIISTGVSATNQRFGFRVNKNRIGVDIAGTLKFYMYDFDEKWHHVAVTIGSGQAISTIKIYVDGELLTIASTQFGNQSTVPNTGVGNLVIGSRVDGATKRFGGSIDEVRIWNTERTQSELIANSRKELIGNESGLVSYFNFNEGSGTIANDLSSNNNDATLTNMDSVTSWTEGAPTGNKLRIVLTASDESGNEFKDSVFVSVKDTIAPTFTANNDTVYLNASGTATANVSDLYSGVADNCGAPTMEVTGDTAFDCSDIGTGNYVTLRLNDASGNSITDSSQVTVLDTIKPLLTLKSADTLYVDANGNTDTLSVYDLIVSATDNCAIADSTLDSLGYFDCTQLDSNLVSVSVADSSGNVTTEYANVTILDTIKPTIAHIGDTTIYLDTAGNASLTASSLYLSSSDNCSAVNMVTASDTSFNCTSTKDTVHNVSGSLVFDGTNDYVNLGNLSAISGANAFTFEAWIKVNSQKQQHIFSSRFTSTGTRLILSTSNPGRVGFDDFDIILENGGNSFALSSSNQIVNGKWNHVALVYDGSATGNTNRLKFYINGSQESLSYTGTLPATTRSGTIDYLLGSNNASAHFFDGSMDEVRIWNSARSSQEIKANYRNSDIASSVSLYRHFDMESTSGAVLNDNSQNVLNGTLVNFNTSTSWKQDTTFTLIGAPVALTIEDESGNTSRDTVYVNVLDTMAPSLTVVNDTVYLDSTGNATLSSSSLYSGISDNCAVNTISVSGDTIFTCVNVQAGNISYVTVEVEDVNGNTSVDSAKITILDTISPSLILKSSDTLYVDANGNTDTLSVYDLIVSATDNCAIADTTLDSLGYFDCSQLDTNGISVTVSDSSGNFTTAFATITVLDTIKPSIAHIGDTTIYLDGSGDASLTAASLYYSASDNCSSTIMVNASDTSFNCSTTIDTVNKVTGAITFNGTTSYITVPHDNSLNPTSEITVEAWINTNVSAQNQKIVGKCKNGSAQNGWGLGITTTGRLGGEFYTTSGNQVAQSSSTIPANTWTHVAMTRKTNGQNRVYINGVLAGSSSASANDLGQETNSMHIGIAPYNLTQYWFDGELDEIRVWNVERSAAEILANKDRQLSGSESGLVAYYQFENGSGTTLSDKTNNGNHGALININASTGWVNGQSVQLIGAPVALTIEDESGNQKADTVYVNVVDTVKPSLTVENDTVYLDASGNGNTTLSSLYSNLSDNCGVLSISVIGDTTFSCLNRSDSNYVAFSAVDNAGNERLDSSLVVVLDTISPSVIAYSDTLYLNDAGYAVIDTAVTIPGGLFGANVSDNCTQDSLWFSQDTFRLADFGSNTVTAFVRDSSGNVGISSFTVWLLDSAKPMAGLNRYYHSKNDQIILPNIPSIAPSGSGQFTIEMWLYKEDFSTGHSLFRKTRGSSGAGSLQIYTDALVGGQLRIGFDRFSNGGWGYFTTQDSLEAGTWNHIAFVKGSGADVKIYINGSPASVNLSGNTTFTSAFPSTGDFQISNAGGDSLKFDEVRFWSASRTASQIKSFAFRPLEGTEPNLEFYYPFERVNGTTIADESGNQREPSTAGSNFGVNDTITMALAENSVTNGYEIARLGGFDLTFPAALSVSLLSGNSGEVTFDALTGILAVDDYTEFDYETNTDFYYTYEVTDTAGLKDTAVFHIDILDVDEKTYAGLGNSMNFTGSGKVIEIDSLLTSNYTIEAWIKPTVQSSINTIIANRASGQPPGLTFDINTWTTTDRKLNFSVGTSGISSPAGLIQDNEWQHVAIAVNGSNGTLYYNGDIVAQSSSLSGTNNGLPWRIGLTSDFAYQYVGNIDEVRVWNVTRDSNDIKENYRKRVDASTTGLYSYFNFDLENGTALTDLVQGTSASFTGFSGNEWQDAQDSLTFEVFESVNTFNSNYTDQDGDTIAHFIGFDNDENVRFHPLNALPGALKYDSVSGDVIVLDHTLIDYETQAEYVIPYTATSVASGTKDTAALVIDVIDLYEPPIVNLPIVETFDGTTTQGWTFSGANGGNFRPTDWLRLTDNGTGRFGIAFYDTAFYANSGIHVAFDYATYGGSGADGFTFFLFDGYAGNPTPGASGGPLGYAPYNLGPTSGLSDAYLGVAFDEYGNFTNTTHGAGGLSGLRPDQVAIRGSGDGMSGYQFHTNEQINTSAHGFNTIDGVSRANKRRVFLYFVNEKVTVRMDLNGDRDGEDAGELIINEFDLSTATNQDSLPDLLKFGFSSATGGLTNYHEIDSVVVTQPGDLYSSFSTLPDHLSEGDTLEYTVQIKNTDINDISAQAGYFEHEIPAVTQYISSSISAPSANTLAYSNDTILGTFNLDVLDSITIDIKVVLDTNLSSSLLLSSYVELSDAFTDVNPADNLLNDSINILPIIFSDVDTISEFAIANDTLISPTYRNAEIWQSLTFTQLPNSYNGTFEVNDSTGVITVALPDSIDFEKISQYVIDVEISDSVGGLDTNQFTISIIDEHEDVYAGLGEALKLDGSSEYVQIPSSNLPTGNASRTVEFWFNAGSSAKNKTIVNWGAVTNATNERFALFYDGNGTIRLVGENNDRPGKTAVDDGNWHHVAATFDGATLSLYIDGKLDTTHTVSYNTSNAVAYIGRRSWANDEHYGGSIDELRIWNYSRDSIDIAENMNRRVAPTSTGLVANYNFDNIGDELHDISGNSGNGTLVNISTPSVTASADSLLFTVSEGLLTGDTAAFAAGWDTDNSQLTYKILSGNNNSTFALDSNTGVFEVANSGSLFYYLDSLYTITYSVTEAGDGDIDTASIRIKLTNENVEPLITSIPGDTVCAGTWSDSLDFTITDMDPEDSTSVLQLLAFASDSVAIPSDSIRFYGNDSTRKVVVSLPYNREVFESVDVTVVVSDLVGATDTSVFTLLIDTFPVPIIDTLPNICRLSTPIDLTPYANINSGGIGVWSGQGVSGSNFVPVATAGTYPVNYEFTDVFGCTSDTTADIIIDPKPNATLSQFDLFCDNSSIDTIRQGTPSGGLYYGTGVLNDSLFDPSVGAGTYTVNYTFENVFGCADTAQRAIEVHLAPTASMSSLPNQCISADPLVLNQGTPVAGGVGAYYGDGITNNVFYPQIADTGIHNVKYVFTDTVGCRDSVTAPIVVDTLPLVSVSALPSICNNAAAISLGQGLPVGGTYSGLGVSTGQFDPAQVNSGTNVIRYTYTDGNGCTDSSDALVTVHPVTQATIATLSNRCDNDLPFTLNTGLPSGGHYAGAGVMSDSVSFNPLSVASGSHNIRYVYQNNFGCFDSANTNIVIDTLPTVGFSSTFANVCANEDTIALSIGTPASLGNGFYYGNGVVNNNLITSLSGVGTHQVSYVFEDLNGCSDTSTQALVVDSVPAVSLNSFSAYCLNESSFILNGGQPQSGGTGVYSGTGVSVGSFDPALSDTGSHKVTYTFTDSQGCTDSASQDILVQPLPNTTFTLQNDSICVSDAAISLSNGLPSGGQYSGTGVTGLIFNPTNAGVGAAEITYEFVDSNGCHNTAVDTMHVIGLPAVSYSEANPSVCEGGLTFALSGATPSGGSYSHPTTGVVDLAGNFNPVAAGVGEHIVTYSVEQFGCANFATDTVTVHALPNVSYSMQQQFCNNGDSIAIAGGTPSGGVYAGPGVTSGFFNPIAAGSGNHDVSYTVITSEGCEDSATVSVTVHTKPTVSFASFADKCAYEQPLLLTQGTPSGSGGTYYNSNGTAISQLDPGQFNIGMERLKYVYEDGNGCQDSAFHITQIKAAPNVFFSAIPDQCENGTPFTLFQAMGSPTGGTGVYSGTGVSGNSYNPGTAGVGVHSVNYTYTALNGCVDSIQQTVVVDSVPLVSFDGVRDFCSNEPSYTLTEGQPKVGGTGVYSGSGVIGTEFFPSFAGFGSQVLTYQFTDANGCTGSDIDTVLLKSSPQINLFGANNSCDSAPNFTLNLHTVFAGQGYGYYSGPGIVGVDTFNSALAGPGIHNLYYVYRDTANGFVCADSALTNITVNPKPQPMVVSTLDACIATPTVFLNNVAPSGGVYLDSSLAGISFNQFKPSDFGLGTHKLFYEYTNLYGCKDTLQTSIDVYNSPSVSFEMPNSSVCIDGNSLALNTGQPAGGTYSGLGVFGSNFIPSLAGLGQQILSYTYADSNSCAGTALDTVNVTTRPTIGVTNDTLVCEGNSAVLSANSSDVNAMYSWNTGASTSSIQIQPTTSTNYRVTISSPAGCTEVREIRVEVVPGMQLFTTSSASQCDDAIGELNTTVIGGQAPYKYQWTTGHRTAQVVNVPGGLYEVTVTDSRGCKALASHIVANDNGPEAQLIELNNVSCFGEQDGVLEIATQGGQGNLTVNWSNGSQAERIDNLDAGIYEVLISDEEECINVYEYEISEPTMLQVTIDTIWPTCGNSDGEIALSIDGGTAPYQVLWNDLDTQVVRQNVPAGIYGVSVQDTNMCNDSITIGLSEIGGPEISLIQEVSPSCDKAVGLLAVSILSDSLQTLMWSNGDTTTIADSLEAGMYSISAVDTSGCQSHLAHNLLPLKPTEKQTCLVTVDTAQQRNVIVWEEDTLIEKVNIYRLQGEETTAVWIGNANQSDGVFLDNAVSAQIRPYRYRIEGVDSCGNTSVLSQEMVGIHVSALAAGQSVEVNWTDAPSLQGSQYAVYRTSSSRGKEYLGAVSYPGNQFVDNAPLFNAGELYYHVEAINESMCSAHSSFDRLVSNYSQNLGNNYVGVSEWTSTAGVALYPNPNNGSFVVRGLISTAQEVAVEVVSVDGRKVYDSEWSLDEGIYKKVIKLETVESGVYFLRIRGEGDVVVKQFVVK